LFFKVNFLVL